MGVKSTVELTRQQAENKLVALLAKHLHGVRSMNDDDVEYALEVLNDIANGGEGFENYRITDGDA